MKSRRVRFTTRDKHGDLKGLVHLNSEEQHQSAMSKDERLPKAVTGNVINSSSHGLTLIGPNQTISSHANQLTQRSKYPSAILKKPLFQLGSLIPEPQRIPDGNQIYEKSQNLRVTHDSKHPPVSLTPYLADNNIRETKHPARAFQHQGSPRQSKTQYSSIRDYEKSQEGKKNQKNGIYITSGTGNILAQNLWLVLNGQRYSIEDNQQHRGEKENNGLIKQQDFHHIQRAQQQQWKPGLMIQNGNFSNQLQGKITNTNNGKLPLTVRNKVTEIVPHQGLHDARLQQAYSQPLKEQPRYRVEKFGDDSNFFQKESLKIDDDHRFYRQHGQRVKTRDGAEQRLYLDRRLAETNDIFGNQMVRGKSAQQVHSGEAYGPNHKTKFHSEMKVSHQFIQPVGRGFTEQEMDGKLNNQLSSQNMAGLGYQQPVKAITYEWPNFSQNEDVSENKPRFIGHHSPPPFPSESFGIKHHNVQRFYQPNLNPHPQVVISPGFERFFESIQDFGPSQRMNPMVDDSRPQLEPLYKLPEERDLLSKVNNDTQDVDSESSSIRSSASAYWPPELRFPSSSQPHIARGWKFHRPALR